VNAGRRARCRAIADDRRETPNGGPQSRSRRRHNQYGSDDRKVRDMRIIQGFADAADGNTVDVGNELIVKIYAIRG
jgi:hypothetical protein